MAALGHSCLCMRTKMNRYDLRVWDVRKTIIIRRELESVQGANGARRYWRDLADSTSTKTE